jgi:AraC-like DNA-binding protein
VNPPVRVTRHDEGGLAWEMARRAPATELSSHFGAYCGYVERSDAPLRRRQVPHGGVVLIMSFGDSISVSNGRSPQPRSFRSFIAGVHDTHVVTEYEGCQRGVQLNLTPLGAYRLLGIPMRELANDVVDLDVLRGREIDRLIDQLASDATWAQRFDLVDRVLARWIAAGPDPDRAVAWAWHQLRQSHGLVGVGDLADEIGWSRRHLASRFREQIGLPPKPVGRVLRFQRAVGLLERGPVGTIADVAAEAGYADHSHLVREFQALAGCAPSEFVAARLPDAGGIAA